jgi:hypothetical protein
MKLMRNITPDGFCKYAAIRNDKISKLNTSDKAGAQQAMETLALLGVLENPKVGDPEEFFLIKLKDVNAPHALAEYAGVARYTDAELADDVRELSERAEKHPGQKQPD